jgi:hypothetical protein
MKTTVAKTMLYGFLAKSKREQLPPCNNAVLPAHQRPHLCGISLKLCPGHTLDKASASDSHPGSPRRTR